MRYMGCAWSTQQGEIQRYDMIQPTRPELERSLADQRPVLTNRRSAQFVQRFDALVAFLQWQAYTRPSFAFLETDCLPRKNDFPRSGILRKRATRQRSAEYSAECPAGESRWAPCRDRVRRCFPGCKKGKLSPPHCRIPPSAEFLFKTLLQ
jgi:hypothetical protein